MTPRQVPSARIPNRGYFLLQSCVLLAALALPSASEAQRIGLETNVNQKSVVGIEGNNGTVVFADGHLRTKRGDVRLKVGNPPQDTGRLAAIPQTLIDGRTPAVVTRRELDGIRYESTAFETILPQVGRTFVLGLKAVNTADKPAKARWTVEPPEAADAGPAKKPAATGWCDGNGRCVAVDNPWAMLSPNTGVTENNWAPTAPPGMKNARIGWKGEPIRYAFRVRPEGNHSVAVAFYEGHYMEAGQRLMDVEIEGRVVARRVDAISQGNPSHFGVLRCVVVAADAPKPSKEGLLNVTIRASDDSPDKNAAVSAVWLFENTPAEKLDRSALAAGLFAVPPVATVACGEEPYHSLTGKPEYVYEWTLGPGESREGQYLSPYGKFSADQLAVARPTSEMLEKTRQWWQSWWSQGTTVRVPDREAEDLYYASLAYLLIMREQIGDYFLVTPGPEAYHSFWYRDAGYLTRSFNVSGHPREAEESLRVFWNRSLPKEVSYGLGLSGNAGQSAEGVWESPVGEYDGQGQAVWGLLSHYRLTGDKNWLEKAYPAILAGAKWTRDARQTTKITDENGTPVPHYGLFPQGLGEAISETREGVMGRGYILYHNFWGVLQLRLSAEAAKTLDRDADAKWMTAEYEDFQKCVENVCRRDFVALGDNRGYWKAAPNMDRGANWWQAAAVFPCEVLTPRDPQVDKVFEQFRSAKVQGIWPTWPYISTEWAQSHLLRNEFDDAESVFWAYIRKATLHRTWPEALDPLSRIGGGDQPHGWAAADFVLLLRNMILAEREKSLWLCQATPREWLAEGKEIEIKNAPTEFGVVSLHVQSHLAAGRIEYAVRGTSARGPSTARLWLRVPHTHVPRKVLIDGVNQKNFSEGFVEFPLGEKEIHITVQCDPKA